MPSRPNCFHLKLHVRLQVVPAHSDAPIIDDRMRAYERLRLSNIERKHVRRGSWFPTAMDDTTRRLKTYFRGSKLVLNTECFATVTPDSVELLLLLSSPLVSALLPS